MDEYFRWKNERKVCAKKSITTPHKKKQWKKPNHETEEKMKKVRKYIAMLKKNC